MSLLRDWRRLRSFFLCKIKKLQKVDIQIVDYNVFVKYMFHSRHFIYRNRPVIDLRVVCSLMSFNNYSVAEWSFDGINSFFPYVMVVSEAGAHYNVMLPGSKVLRKLKKKLIHSQYLSIISDKIKMDYYKQQKDTI